MKKLSRLDLRTLIEEKADTISEAAYDVPTRRDAAMSAARAAIEKKYGAGAIYDPGFDEIMTKQMERTKSPETIQDIALAYDLMIKHAPNVESLAPITTGAVTQSGLRQVVGEISAKTGLDKRFIRFHLNKAVNHAEQGKLVGLPTGQDLVQKVMGKRDAATREREAHLAATTEMIGGRRISKIPAAGRGKGRPTYGHTSIGTRFAPDGMSDEEAVDYLKSQYRGAPMWKFDISRDPDSGKIYAYYEIDTSG